MGVVYTTSDGEPWPEEDRTVAKLRARISALESAIRGLVVDVSGLGSPAYTCSACSAYRSSLFEFEFEHEKDCPAKPALDLVFGPRDADHVKGEG